MAVGEDHGILPFGVEAQRILRLEKAHIIVGQDTDALSDPISADMAWSVKLDKKEILVHCNRHLENFMVPKFSEIVPDLPKNMNGKIDKLALLRQETTTNSCDD